MKKKEINTIAMVRSIREAHTEQFKNCSHEEQIAFYREEARKMNERAKEIMRRHQNLKSKAIEREYRKSGSLVEIRNINLQTRAEPSILTFQGRTLERSGRLSSNNNGGRTLKD
jgi:hypothetical protein